MAIHSMLSPRKSHGHRHLGGLQSMGLQKSQNDLVTKHQPQIQNKPDRDGQNGRTGGTW